MRFLQNLASFSAALVLISSAGVAFAHGSGQGDFSDGFIVTRHFTGIWDQVDQEAQGIALQVVEQSDDSRKSVAYWYTYGADRKTAWFMAIGDLIEDRIEAELFESTDVGFMQDALPGNASVQSIGTMTIVFDSCESGVVTYETNHAEVGSGSFNIERLLEVMNTHCSGGISDDMHADAMFGEQRIELMPAREAITGNGHAGYDDYPAHMEFEVEVDGLPDGGYHLYVGMQDRGDFTVQSGHGGMQFASPGETGKMLLTFDPRGKQIDIHDNQGLVLSSLGSMFNEDDHGHHGDGDGQGHNGDGDHNFDCEMGHGPGHGMGTGMDDCVNEGEFVEIEIDLENTGTLPEASGEAEWEMNAQRVEFSVAIEDVPVGSYPLIVGGVEVGIIEAFEMHDGDVYGRIKFRDPESYGREHLDFEPRGQKIEVLQGANIILEVEFPTE
jgi:hypothetical protein